MSDELEQAIDSFGATANRIADQLIACRKLNRKLVAALVEITENAPCDCGAGLTAMVALNGGAE